MNTKFFAAMLLFFAVQARASITWPDDSEWKALKDGSGEYSDVQGDSAAPGNSNQSLDLVGDDTHSAGYILYVEGSSDTNLFLRMRVDAAPNGKNKDVAWYFLFDTDSSAGVDYIVTLQGTMKKSSFDSGNLTIQEVTTGGTNSATIRSSVVWSTTAIQDDNMRFETADTSINGSEDYFVDMAIPWEAFSMQTGVLSTNEGIAIALATDDEYTAGGIDAGLAEGDIGAVGAVGSGGTDLASALSEAIPEPAMVSLILVFGGMLMAVHRFLRT